jgi:CubicO group peptidase (beta-lactamase class C family)
MRNQGRECRPPDEEILGKSKGYPIGDLKTAWEEPYRVGSYSAMDQIFPHRVLHANESPLELTRCTENFDLHYAYEGNTRSIDDYLSSHRTTGLLLLNDREIVFERYQYERTETHRFYTQSVSKSIVSLAVGIALAEGKIDSLQDTVAEYEPALAGSPFGNTPIEALLRMSSGVKFRETYDGADDWSRWVKAMYQQGSIPAVLMFQDREAEPGEVYRYASINTLILALAVRAATGTSLSDWVAQRLWRPMGAEHDATWLIYPVDGVEIAQGGFSATLRDYARLGRLLACDGLRDDRQVIPREYLLRATSAALQPPAFQSMIAEPYYGYGFQFRIFPCASRRFALLGIYGQYLFVDPTLRLVMVHTGATRDPSDLELYREAAAMWRAFVERMGGNW